VSSHDLRKFFGTHMKLGVEGILVEYWMGHSLGRQKRAYFAPPSGYINTMGVSIFP